MSDTPDAAARGMQPTANQQMEAQGAGVLPPEQDVGAATSPAGISRPVPATESVPATAAQVLSAADVVKAATKALSAVGGSQGSSASSGLMIDGFLVPPHVLQALQRLGLQELRLQAGRSTSTDAPQPILQDIVAAPAPHAAAEPDAGAQDAGAASDQAAQVATPDAAGTSPSGGGPSLLPPDSEAAIQESCGSPPCSSSGRGRGVIAGCESRGSSLSSGRHSCRSGSSGRSSGSGRSGLSGRGIAAGHASGVESESDEHVHSLEAAVAELSTRSAANAAVITQLNTDITSLSTTNETLRQRLLLLTGQLRHRDVEIDKLRVDVRRLRAVLAGPIDNKSSRGSNGGSRA